jgi:hypothetical protein
MHGLARDEFGLALRRNVPDTLNKQQEAWKGLKLVDAKVLDARWSGCTFGSVSGFDTFLETFYQGGAFSAANNQLMSYFRGQNLAIFPANSSSSCAPRANHFQPCYRNLR